MKRYLKQQGFTLIETLIYVAVFSVVVGGMVTFLRTAQQNRINSQAFLEVNQQGNQVLNLITQTLRNATAVNTPVFGGTSSSLSVNTALASTTPTVFTLNSGVLYITEGSAPQVALTNSRVQVSNLVFENLSQNSTPATVRVNFKMQNTTTAAKAEYNYSANFFGSGSVRP